MLNNTLLTELPIWPDITKNWMMKTLLTKLPQMPTTIWLLNSTKKKMPAIKLWKYCKEPLSLITSETECHKIKLSIALMEATSPQELDHSTSKDLPPELVYD